MDEPSVCWTVLRLLERWERLPLSDVVRMLGPLERPRFRDELVKRIEREGLIQVHLIGDEQVLELTPSGQLKLGESSRPSGPHASEV
jgi:hypothetical protein